MVLTIHGVGTPQSTSQALSVPANIINKPLNPGRKIECYGTRMMGKFPDVQFGIRFSIWNVGKVGGGRGGIPATLTLC